MRVHWALVLSLCAATTAAWGQTSTRRGRKPAVAIGGEVGPYDGSVNPAPKMHPLAAEGAAWLLKMQQADGGWPRASRFSVPGPAGPWNAPSRAAAAPPSDYSTSAMAGLALVRTGATPAAKEGNPLREAIRYVADVATAAEPPNPAESQPSYKLGPLAGPAHATQFLARVLPMLPADDPLHRAVTAALEKNVTRLEKAEHAFLQGGVDAAVPEGSESESTIVEPPRPAAAARAASFSPVHHVLICLTALETARAAGREVDAAVLARLRRMLAAFVDPRTGAIDDNQVMSTELYAFSSAMRSTAVEARAAQERAANHKGAMAGRAAASRLPKPHQPPPVAIQQALVARLAAADERLLIGFGSLGGEEFLSYLLIGEALVLDGDPRTYGQWHKALVARLARSQRADGSWAGLHCITDPIYMTAAAVQALTADRDEPLLLHIARQAAEEAD
jgi:hypothetical protein